MTLRNRTRRAARPALEAMESRQVLSATADPTGAAVVTGLYREILLRDPQPQELARLAPRVAGTEQEVRRVAGVLYASPEFRRNQVDSYYDELLGRDATPAELRRWTSVVSTEAGTRRLVGDLAGSTEYYAKAGGTGDAFVRSLYLDLFARQPTAPEVATYVTRIDAGLGVGQIASQFAASPEFRQTRIREAYQVVLDRQPAAVELDGWTSRWQASGGMRGVALGLLGGVENRARMQQAAVALPDLASAAALRQILEAPYTEAADGFVQTFNRQLGTQTPPGDGSVAPPSNLALWQMIRAGGMADGRPFDEVQEITATTVDVARLIPTQSEIDLDKSLKFVLSADAADSDLKAYLAGGIVSTFGGPILTGGSGSYIVDGHHRWSSVYVVNPYAQMMAFDLGRQASPQDALKLTQMAIGAQVGYLAVQSVDGQNLFTIDRPSFDAWVASTIQGGDNPQSVLDAFKDAKGVDGIPAITDYLWANVERMRQFNRSVPGATSRDYMPQPPGSDLQSLFHRIESGFLNFRAPVVARLG